MGEGRLNLAFTLQLGKICPSLIGGVHTHGNTKRHSKGNNNRTYGNIPNKFGGTKRMKLNFGSGEVIMKGWDNADVETHNGANIIFDFEKLPYPIKDNTYDYILANHVLEHLYHPDKIIQELGRIAKHNCILEINVPHMNSEGAFNIGHISYWTKNSFILLTTPVGWERKNNYKLEMISIDLTPTWFSKYIPSTLRFHLSRLIRGMYNEIKCKMRVIKEVE